MKGYILSSENGVVQIGNTVFQPKTGAIFTAGRDGLSSKPWVDVPEKSMVAAREALRKDAAMRGFLTIQVDAYTDFDSFEEAVLNMGNSIQVEFGFDGVATSRIIEIIDELREWFSFSANRAECKDGS